MKKFLFGVLALALVLTAASAFAATTTYTGTVDPIVIDQPGEHTIILDGVTISLEDGSALRLEAPATKLTIILRDGTESTLTSNDTYAATLFVSTGTLVIRCERAGEGHVCDDTCGKLSVTSDSRGATIGGDEKVDMSGTIHLAGGHITARQGNYSTHDASAIGSGGMAGMSGTILITGGELNAVSNGYGPAIGGGTSYTMGGSLTSINRPMSGDIIITGGIVNASNPCNNQGWGGSAIGASLFGEVTGTISISGGTVTATSRCKAAIGSGDRDMSGTISITGGKVVAEGRPAIGSGATLSGKILLLSGDITATGLSYSSAIGSMYKLTGNIVIGSDFAANLEAVGGNDGTTIGGAEGGSRMPAPVTVVATSGAEGTAIGADSSDMAGTITILRSATVTVDAPGPYPDRPLAYAGGAGIGSGRGGSMTGTIIIDGATVTATAYYTGSGIGMGEYAPSNSEAHRGGRMDGQIIIRNGATVTATGGQYGSGIGSESRIISAKGHITITDSTVIAEGGDAGIGFGCWETGMTGSISITRSKVTATGDSVGIGCNNDHLFGSLTITDSTVTATGGSVGIGGVMIGSEGSVTVTGSTVTARSTEWGSGIGSGCWMLGTIRLINSTIDAYGGENGGVGVGTGMDARLPSADEISERGIRSAAKSYPVDEWYDEVYIGRGGKLIISGGTVNAYGSWSSAGIGGDVGPMCMDIIIESGTVTAVGGKYAPGIGTCYPADMFGSLTVKGGHVKAISGDADTPAIPQTAAPIWDEYMDFLAEEAVICVDPARGPIEVKVGASEEDAAPLANSPFSARTDLIPLLNREAYVEFLPVVEPTPVPVVPTTGDSMNLALVALIAILSLSGAVVLRRLHKA